MSGSEDEGDFASADEGEPETQTKEPVKKKGPVSAGSAATGSSKSSVKDSKASKTGSHSKQAEKPAAKTDEKPVAKKKQTKGAQAASSKRDAAKGSKSADSSKKVTESGTGKPKDSNDDKLRTDQAKVSGDSGKTEKEDSGIKKDDKLEAVSDKEKTVTEVDSEKTEKAKLDIKASGDIKEEAVGTKSEAEPSGDKTEEPQADEVPNANLIKSPSSQSIQRPGPDHTQEQEEVLKHLAEAAKPQSGWGWGWGSSLLDAASTSVSTFTKEVGEGIHTVMETVESTLSVPAPEKLAEGWEDELDDNEDNKEGTVTEEPHHQPEPKIADPTQEEAEPTQSEAAESVPPGDEKKNQSDEGAGWFSSWGVSDITSMVQKSGKTFVSGGLDVLESIGKKTFDVIKDHDPGLRKTKGLLFERGDKPNLSQVLKDAKEQREAQEKLQQESEEARKAHFGFLFDDFQGLAHLEALEMLSNQSEKRVSSLLNALPPETITSIKPQLLQIKENFEIGEEDEEVEQQDFVRLVTDLFTNLSLGNSPVKLTTVQDNIQQQVTELSGQFETETKPEPKEIHQSAIRSLAELTSKSIEQFHKTGELMLIKKTEQTDLVLSSKHLASLTKVLCAEVGILSTKFTECLNKCLTEENSAVVNPLVTNVYLEATNSSSYIQDGFQLLLPVLQQTALEKTQEPDG